MIKAELLKELENVPDDAHIIVGGCYGSLGGIEDFEYVKADNTILLLSDICSG